MATNSIMVHDIKTDKCAYGYQHHAGDLEYSELIDSALAVNKERNENQSEPIDPVMFLAEWHDLSLKKWDDPSEHTLEAIQRVASIGMAEDDNHYSVLMSDGLIREIVAYRLGSTLMSIKF